mgnify:CR=1 FL=1
MKLKDLLQDISVLECTADPEMTVSAVHYDSRKVTPGSLFVAISGFAADGNRFIPMALQKGAAVVVTAKKPEQDIPYVLVENDRLALAMLGINFYGHPVEDMTLIGVTGTNGKTSSTLLLKQVLETCLNAKVGLIGTMENLIGHEVIPTERTTPESFELQGLFARMRDAGCTHVVMEVSSHAITLDRVGGVHFDVAAFTNLTEDHLDFHKTMDAYCDAKAELFRRCDKAVINVDDSYADRILDAAACPVLTTSLAGKDGLHAENLELLSDGVSFTAVSGQEKVEVKLPIPGKFTVYNALTVLGCAIQLGITLDASTLPMYSGTGETAARLSLERKLAAQGDLEARNILIERNLRLVAHIMKKYYAAESDQEDLISIGTIGLIKSISTYRRDKNIKLATYSSRCIENEILMHIRKISNQKTEISLDEPINMDYDGNELLLSDILGTQEDTVTCALEDDVDLHLLRQALQDLPERERQIIHMRFGLGGFREMTQKEVAQVMGISQSYISRLEKRIMQRLKKEFLRQTSCA